MKRDQIKNKKETERLDSLNNKRVDTTLKRVAYAIKLLSYPQEALLDERINKLEELKNSIAHAGNLLEAANEEMTWACNWFGWNNDICLQIDEAISKIGMSLAILTDKDIDLVYAGSEVQDASSILGKVICTLVRWFDDTADVSEV